MKSRRILSGLVAGALVASLAAPLSAYALPGRGTPRFGAPKPSNNATRQANAAQRRDRLMARIAEILAHRQQVFDATADRIGVRIDRAAAIASKVETAGADVSAVRTKLDEARALLVFAKAEEALAIDMFKNVPNATDKRAEFAAARSKAKVAVQTLKKARATLRDAILDLRSIANGLKGAQ